MCLHMPWRSHAHSNCSFCVSVQASPDQLNNFQHCQSMLRLWLSGMLEPGMRATVLELTKVRLKCIAAATLVALLTPVCHATVCIPSAANASSGSCAVST